MAGHSAASIEQFRDEMLQQLARRPSQLSRGAQFESAEAKPRTLPPVALGLSGSRETGNTLAIRVQGTGQAGLREAERVKAEAEKRGIVVDFAAIEEAYIPRKEDLTGLPGHPVLSSTPEQHHLGLSIGHANGGAGTLGCFVSLGDIVALVSCCHVLVPDDHFIGASSLTPPPIRIHQPGRPELEIPGGHTHIATLRDSYVEFSTEGNRIDAAIAALTHPERCAGNLLPHGVGCPFEGRFLAGVVDLSDVDARESMLGTRVGKIGRTTGYTEGTLTALSLTPVVVNSRALGARISFEQAIEVSWDVEKPFTEPGDSGAAVFTTDGLQAVGLHFCSPRKGGRSYACPLYRVLREFRAELFTP